VSNNKTNFYLFFVPQSQSLSTPVCLQIDGGQTALRKLKLELEQLKRTHVEAKVFCFECVQVNKTKK
jgi:hypothetical protein